MDYNFFDLLDEPESWTAPLTPQPHLPSAWQQLPDSLFPSESGASSPESPPRTPSPPTTSSSPREPSEDSHPINGANSEALGPTASGRVQAKCLLITWSQAPNLSKELIRDHLSTLGEIAGLAVGMENHMDGGVHFHACVIYQKKIRKQLKDFTFLGRVGNVRPANAKRGPLAQCILNYWTYAQKEDPNPLILGVAPVLKKAKNEIYREAIDLAEKESVNAAMDHLNAYAPMDYVQRMDQLTRSLTAHRDKKRRVMIPPRKVTDFDNAPTIPEEWKVLFLWGKTGLGKTQFAKALLPEATIVRHRNQLNQCDFSKGIIFDDFDVSHWPPSAVIHLLDWDEVSGIDVKYGMVTIPPRTRKIFTFNKRPDAWAPLTNEETFQAILRRMHVIELNERLY